jgi:hypothetical protein
MIPRELRRRRGENFGGGDAAYGATAELANWVGCLGVLQSDLAWAPSDRAFSLRLRASVTEGLVTISHNALLRCCRQCYTPVCCDAGPSVLAKQPLPLRSLFRPERGILAIKLRALTTVACHGPAIVQHIHAPPAFLRGAKASRPCPSVFLRSSAVGEKLNAKRRKVHGIGNPCCSNFIRHETVKSGSEVFANIA